MYVPTNIAAPAATYAPVTPASTTSVLQTQAISGVRQTEVAVAGLGAALLSNQTAGRSQQNNVSTRATLVPVTINSSGEVVADSPLEMSAPSVGQPITNTARGAPVALSLPRPSYIAAQFLAQDLSPQEAAVFFTGSGDTRATRETQRHQAQLRDMRIALGMEKDDLGEIVIRQATTSATTRSTVEAPRASAYAPTLQVRNQSVSPPAEEVQKFIRRGSLVQTYGESAYNTANLRNERLASPPEVDTTL